jgi:hypothetical protein
LCQPTLRSIFERSFRIKTGDRVDLKELPEPDGNTYAVAFADLLRFYRREKGHFPRKPFLKPDPERVEYWKKELEKLGDRKKIGIAWKSRHGHLDPVSLMREDAIYINLQYTGVPHWSEKDKEEKREEYEKYLNHTKAVPNGVIDFGPEITSPGASENKFALIAALDEVRSVTQTVVHMAGAVGTKCLAIRPPRHTGEVNNILWYYPLGESPVYGSVTVRDKP